MNQLLAIAYLVILNNYVSRNHMLMRHDPTNWSHLFLPKIPATAGKYKLLKYSASFSWDISLLRSWSSQSCLLLIDTVNAATWRFFPVKREIYEIPVSKTTATHFRPHMIIYCIPRKQQQKFEVILQILIICVVLIFLSPCKPIRNSKISESVYTQEDTIPLIYLWTGVFRMTALITQEWMAGKLTCT